MTSWGREECYEDDKEEEKESKDGDDFDDDIYCYN